MKTIEDKIQHTKWLLLI